MIVDIIIPGDPTAQARHRARMTLRKDYRASDLRHCTRAQIDKWARYNVKLTNYDPSAKAKATVRAIGISWARTHPEFEPFRDQPLFSLTVFCRERPKSWPKRKGLFWDWVGQDRDNLDKLILDSLQGIIYDNDSRFVGGVIYKLFAKDYDRGPHTRIWIWPATSKPLGAMTDDLLGQCGYKGPDFQGENQNHD